MFVSHTIHRRALLLWVPIAILLLELTHPVDWSAHVHGPEVIARDTTWWTLLHVIQLPLFGLLSLAVLTLGWKLPGRAAIVSRIGVALFLVFYTAHDSITGIASGLVMREASGLSGDELALAESLAGALFLGGGAFTFIPALGMLGWVLAAGGLAVALAQAGASRWPVALLVVAAVAFGITHEPPFGPIGMAAFAAAVALIEYAPRVAWPACPVRASLIAREGAPS